ncbi:MAG: hypothetical protein DRG25_04650 [Deltaproteobacteria bacterium]|nr:MAG: hypothetical protein DRG25_04650 [Deltaproteobacteria bacterium]
MTFMEAMPSWAVTAYAISIALYMVIVVPYSGAKMLRRFGQSERFWYYFFFLLHFYGVIYILFKYRRKLLIHEIIRLLLFLIGYITLSVPLWLQSDAF